MKVITDDELRALDGLTDDLERASFAQTDYLAKRIPVGAIVEFKIMHGQKKPSTGKVVGHQATLLGGVMIVLHDQAKAGSRYSRRRVGVEQIVKVLI